MWGLYLYNFFADYIVLSLVRQDLFPEIGKKRIAAGAGVGVLLYIGWSALEGTLPAGFYALSGIFTVAALLCIIFKIRSLSSFGRMAGALFLSLFALGGIVTFFCAGVGGEKFRPVLSLLVMAGGGGVLCFWRRQKRNLDRCTQEIYSVYIWHGGKKTECRALYDSGNLLKSALNGQGVFVIDRLAAKAILTPQEKEIFSEIYRKKEVPWELLAENLCSGIHLVRYTSVGKESGVMPGFEAERVLVKKNGKVLADRKGVFGVSREKLSPGGHFSVLLPADILLSE